MLLNQCPCIYQYLFKNHVTNNEEAFVYDERNNIGKSLFSEVSSLHSLRCPIDKCFRKVNAFFDFRFEDKTSEDTFRRGFYGIVVCTVIKSKVEIDFKIRKKFCTIQNFLQPE